jgi:hypothetical protein
MAVDSITAIATCVVAVATVVAVAIAILGLRTWSAQLEGTAQFDLARRLLLAVYEVRDSIDNVRHPLLSSSEAADANPDIPWEITAYENRWSGVRAAMVQLQAATREAAVLWEKPVTPLVEPLSAQVGELFDAVATVVDIKRGAAHVEPLTTEQRSVLYSRGPEDAYNTRLRNTVEKFEHYVAPHLPQRRHRVPRVA